MAERPEQRGPHPYRDKVEGMWAKVPGGDSNQTEYFLALSRRNSSGARIPGDPIIQVTQEEFDKIQRGTLVRDLPPKVRKRIESGIFLPETDEVLPSGCIPGLLKLLRLIR